MSHLAGSASVMEALPSWRDQEPLGKRQAIALPLMGAALGTLGLATLGAQRGWEPFATWYFPFAWYSLLACSEGVHARMTGRFHLLESPSLALATLAWSVPFWLGFELLNFRMTNWYYVFVPDDALWRWVGIVLSFATVLPSILMSERAVAGLGLFARMRSRTFEIPRWLPGTLQGTALAMIALALFWPRFFYPLIWGSLALFLDPLVYRRTPTRSLLGALATGRPALPARLVAGGLGIGVLWELLNAGARARWIYTVPGLETFKLWEMPLPGFLGFPVLALDGWAAWQALAMTGLAFAPRRERELDYSDDTSVPGRGARRPTRTLRLGAVAVAVLFSALVLRGMEQFTISSSKPRMAAIAGEAQRATPSRGIRSVLARRCTARRRSARHRRSTGAGNRLGGPRAALRASRHRDRARTRAGYDAHLHA